MRSEGEFSARCSPCRLRGPSPIDSSDAIQSDELNSLAAVGVQGDSYRIGIPRIISTLLRLEGIRSRESGVFDPIKSEARQVDIVNSGAFVTCTVKFLAGINEGDRSANPSRCWIFEVQRIRPLEG